MIKKENILNHQNSNYQDNKEEKFLHFLIIQNYKNKQTIHLQEEIYSIGRSSKNSILIDSPQVSRIHGTLLKTTKQNNELYTLIDGDLNGKRSRNGIYINGIKAHKHELQHGDLVQFSHEVRAIYQILSESLYLSKRNTYSQKTRKKMLEEAKQTQCIPLPNPNDNQDKLERDELIRLASFPELCPNPIIEVNWSGEITYINASGHQKFPDLDKEKLKHPLLAKLRAYPKNINGNVFKREVAIKNQVFEEYIHYLNENKLIRIYIFEITHRKRLEKKLHYQAYYDITTNLPNRTFFNQQFSKEIANAKRNKKTLAVMFVDLDRFKKINDTLGHKTGDLLLKNFGKRLKICLREGDYVARWGGDEFIILLPQIESTQNAAKIADRIIQILKKPFIIEGNKFHVTTSIGIAVYPNDGINIDILMKKADAALYQVKEKGRNNYCFYNKKIEIQSSQWLITENYLHRALENKELLLYYQPQINITTGKIEGLEALIRWNHPEKGILNPAKFLSIAEETGLIIEIGEWVIQQVCIQNQIWQKLGLPEIEIGINLSARQFQEGNFVKKISQILAQTNVKPNLLELEITEKILMENEEKIAQSLYNLRKIGLHIAMKNFGTGYSCLSYLRKSFFHTLKIDSNFIREIKNNKQDKAIIEAAMAIARGFNMRLIAEGVETLDKLELLQALKCEIFQGSCLSQPLASEQIPSFLEKTFIIKTQKIDYNNINYSANNYKTLLKPSQKIRKPVQKK